MRGLLEACEPQEAPTTLTDQLHFFSSQFFQSLATDIFFSAFILKVPAANTYLNCHWLTPKDETVRFPKINVPQENHSFGQVHIGYESLQLPGGSFNQLYCIGAHYTKPAGFADINARTMKNPTFCDLTRKSNPLQSLLSSRGSGVEIAHSDSSLFRHPRSLAV